jgi:hypothetical protein
MHHRSSAFTLVAVLALVSAPAAMAQGGIGIKGGLAYSDVSNSGVLPGDLHSRTGYAIGLGVESSAPVGFGLEALYAQRGVSGGTLGESRELNYVDVPLYLRVGAPTPGISPFAYAGPQVSFEIQCRSGGGDCPDTGRPKTTYAGVIGAGVRLAGGLSVEGRYVYGLTDLKLSTVSTSESYKNRSFMVLLGLGF